MFCPKCGNEVSNDSRFCTVCGAQLSSVNEAAEPENDQNGEVVFESSGSGGRKIAVIIAAVVAVAAVIAVVLAVWKLMPDSGDGNVYAYLSNGKYDMITDLDKDKTIEIASSKSDSAVANMLAFSPDEKYIYYYTKYDDYNGTGTLCRAEYSKLKADSAKNEKYIEDIASNVRLGFRFLNDGSIIYKNGSDILYCFNGKEAVQIAKNVGTFYTDGDKKIVYETGNYDEGYALYGVNLGDIDNKEKLASNYSYVYNAEDLDNILFVKYDEEKSADILCAAGFSKEPAELGSDVRIFTTTDGKTYFTAVNGTTLNLYDFVEDTYADADAGIEEPDEDDFTIPAYYYEMITDSEPKEEDYDGVELYTSCTHELYWYGEDGWYNYSMEESLDEEWGDEAATKAIHDATQQFIDKYADTEDDGYILVTDEVKSALKKINDAANVTDGEWLQLCFTREESGTTIDYDAYNAAYDEWYEASDRIEMRETLKAKENEYPVRTLYCFDKGTVTALNENVLDVWSYTGAILYNTTDMISDKIRLEDVSSNYDVTNLFYLDANAENNIILANGTACKMSANAAAAFGEAYEDNYATLYFVNDDVYMSAGDKTLSWAAISGGTVGDFSVAADDASVFTVRDNILYYSSGSYQNNDVTYCDLYSMKKGESTRMARDIILDEVNLYSDGMLFAYTGSGSYSGYELSMFNSDGEATLIGDQITQYLRIDESKLLYISDGSLYYYNGKEKKLVRSGVNRVWSLHSMDISSRLSWYGYEY